MLFPLKSIHYSVSAYIHVNNGELECKAEKMHLFGKSRMKEYRFWFLNKSSNSGMYVTSDAKAMLRLGK